MGRFGGVGGQGRTAGRLALLGVLGLTLAGCGAAEDWKRAGLPQGITEESLRVENLWRGAWIAAMLVGIGVWGLILWSCAAYRRRRADTGFPPQVRYNIPIEMLYTALPFVVIIVLFVFTARDETALMRLEEGTPTNAINVVGKQWSWDFNYSTANVYETGTPGEPPTLVLPRGEKVRFNLTSRDVIHSFWVPTFLFKLDVIPGRVNSFEATPERTGFFVGKCAEFCGMDHSRMLFNVRVVERAEYDAYLQGLRDQGKEGSLPTELGPKTQLESETESESRDES